MTTEEGTQDSYTEECSSGTSASKNPTDVTNVKLDSVSDIKLNFKLIMIKCSQVRRLLIQLNLVNLFETHSPPEVRRSTRSTKGIPSTRYGPVTSHMVNISTKFGKWLKSM